MVLSEGLVNLGLNPRFLQSTERDEIMVEVNATRGFNQGFFECKTQ